MLYTKSQITNIKFMNLAVVFITILYASIILLGIFVISFFSSEYHFEKTCKKFDIYYSFGDVTNWYIHKKNGEYISDYSLRKSQFSYYIEYLGCKDNNEFQSVDNCFTKVYYRNLILEQKVVSERYEIYSDSVDGSEDSITRIINCIKKNGIQVKNSYITSEIEKEFAINFTFYSPSNNFSIFNNTVIYSQPKNTYRLKS